MTQSKDVIEEWIEAVNSGGCDLTNWEVGFMESITEQFERDGFLTDRQEEILERIYAKTP